MAIFSKEYGSLSYESGDMIEDVKQDIVIKMTAIELLEKLKQQDAII